MPLHVPTPPHETTYQRQLQDAWEEGYDTVMKSPSQHAHTPSPSRTVYMRSPTPTPTHVILPMPRRQVSPKQPTITPPPDSPLTSPTAQFLVDWKNYIPDIRETQRKYVVTEDVKDPRHHYYKYLQMQQAKHHYDGTVRIEPEDGPSKDTADLEAVEDPELVPSTAHDIPSHATSEALPLDATTREDTMREDAPLATSHDMSMFLSRSDDVMLDEEL
jgi:hypothetical protein